MNIFATDPDPVASARALDAVHAASLDKRRGHSNLENHQESP
jgi:hypothetical protein